MKKTFYFFSLLALGILGSCGSTDTNLITDKGVYILNEGAFGRNNASLSLFNPTTRTVENQVFYKANNNQPLGDVGQSVSEVNGNLYMVMNTSNYVQIMNLSTRAQAGRIEGLNQPRYLHSLSNNTAYISEWGTDGRTGTIALVDLNSKTITSRISTEAGPEQMARIGNSVYVACTGGYGDASKLQIIDVTDNTAKGVIELGTNAPFAVVAKNTDLWVYCAGKYDYTNNRTSQKARLIKINTTDNSIAKNIELTDAAFSSSDELVLSPDGLTLYYTLNGNLYAMNTISFIPTLLVKDKNITAVALGSSNTLYLGSTPSYTAAGKFLRYTTSGTGIDSTTVGIAPGAIYIKN